MDLTSARALLLACKHNPVQGILLGAYKEEVREFTRPQPRQAPADQCREARGRGHCRGRVSEIAVAQFCPYHQRVAYDQRGFARITDRHVNGVRLLCASGPALLETYQRVVRAATAEGL